MLTFLLLGFINPSNEIISYFTKFGGAELIRTRCEAEPFLSGHAQGTHHPTPLVCPITRLNENPGATPLSVKVYYSTNIDCRLLLCVFSLTVS